MLVKSRCTGYAVTEIVNTFHISPEANGVFYPMRKLHSKNNQGLFKSVLYPFHLHNHLISIAKKHIMNSNSSREVKVAERVLITSLFELIFSFIFVKFVTRNTKPEAQGFGTSYRMYPLVGIFIVRSNVKI